MGGGEALAGEAGSPRSPELYDFSDDSDYAAAAAASNHVMRSKSADGSSGETARADVIYEKQRLTIHPTQYGSDRISGKLRLFLQQGSLFLSWEPNEGVDSWSSSTVNMEIEKYRNLYTIKALPLSDVRFIRRHAPTFGSDYIIIVLSSGLTFPPFYFYNGGVRELFATLKQHVSIIRSDDDPNVFLVNDFQDPLQKSLSSLELPGVATVANAMSRQNSLSFAGPIDGGIHGNDGKHGAAGAPSSMSQYGSRQKHKSNDPGRDLSIQVLEKFSLVTKFARDTTSSLFRDNSGPNAYGSQRQEYYNNKVNDKNKYHQTTAEQTSVPSDPLEPDHLPLVWGKQRERPLTAEEWRAFLDPEGRVMDSKALKKKVFYGGVDHVLRKEVLYWSLTFGN